MSARNALTGAPPFAVEKAIKTLGTNLKTARLRRNLGLAELASRLGVERHVLADAERGKPSTGIAIYAGMLWAMGMVEQLGDIADPNLDDEGMTLARSRGRERARPASGGLSNDF